MGRLEDFVDFVVVLAAVEAVVSPDRIVPAAVVSVPSRQVTDPRSVVVVKAWTKWVVWVRSPIPEPVIPSLPWKRALLRPRQLEFQNSLASGMSREDHPD